MPPKGKAADKGKGKGKDASDGKDAGKQQKGAQVRHLVRFTVGCQTEFRCIEHQRTTHFVREARKEGRGRGETERGFEV